jgi:hypothetical protein
VEELIGSLKTFEVTLNDRAEKKSKGMTLVSNTESNCNT